MKRQRDHPAFTLVELPVVRKGETKGFTLVELLVVIAIIALLIALFVPNMAGIVRRGRTFQCQTNLRHICEAVMDRRAVVGGDRDKRLLAGAWPSSLMPYLDMASTIVICPEDADPTGGGFTENFPVQMAVSPPGTWEGITHYLDLVPGPMVRKLSVQQHADWWPTGQAGVQNVPETYDGPEGFPVTYFLTFEDVQGGGDMDINDCQVKIELDANGVPTFYPADNPWSGFQFFLVWSADDTNALESDEPLAVYPGETRSVTAFGTAASYGMNDDVAELEGGTEKILAVDYEQIVANSSTDQWTDWHDENGVPAFARHGGKMNVLHMDGSVKLRSPGQIDPIEASVAEKYWQP